MKGFMSQDEVKKIKEQYAVGTRIELDNMSGENDMPSGLQGEVMYIDDAGQIGMKWDNNRSLSLVPNEDSFHIIREKEDKIKVLVVEPNKEPYVSEVENHYKAMQKIVGGYIEYVALPDGECHLYCNEEGKLDGLAGNRRMDNDDIICGTFFICSSNSDGSDISLTNEQIAHYTERFRETELYSQQEASDFSYTITSVSSKEEFLKMMGITPNENDDIER